MEETPQVATGKSSDIPVPSLGTPEPTGQIPVEPLLGEISDSPSRQQRRRGRRNVNAPDAEKTAGPEPQPINDVEAQQALAVAIGNAARVLFSIAAAARGEHWNITDKDAESLGISGAVALGPYMGSAGKWLPLALFGLNVAGVALPRLQRDAQLAKELAAKEPPQPANIAVLP